MVAIERLIAILVIAFYPDMTSRNVDKRGGIWRSREYPIALYSYDSFDRQTFRVSWTPVLVVSLGNYAIGLFLD